MPVVCFWPMLLQKSAASAVSARADFRKNLDRSLLAPARFWRWRRIGTDA
jgi:hypothetical protein